MARRGKILHKREKSMYKPQLLNFWVRKLNEFIFFQVLTF